MRATPPRLFPSVLRMAQNPTGAGRRNARSIYLEAFDEK